MSDLVQVALCAIEFRIWVNFSYLAWHTVLGLIGLKVDTFGSDAGLIEVFHLVEPLKNLDTVLGKVDELVNFGLEVRDVVDLVDIAGLFLGNILPATV